MPLFDFCLQFEHYRPVADLGGAIREIAGGAGAPSTPISATALDEGRRQLVALHLEERPGLAGSALSMSSVASRCRGAAPVSLADARLGLIGRGGSKGVPGKNIRLLNGEALARLSAARGARRWRASS
jgi:hypothetical protein